MRRSVEMREFLSGVLCTYAEGGVQLGGIGSVIKSETHDDEDNIPVYDSVTVTYVDRPNEEFVVTPDTIAHGVGVMRRGPVEGLHDESRAAILSAYNRHDAGDVDAVRATFIVETALFRKVEYG